MKHLNSLQWAALAAAVVLVPGCGAAPGETAATPADTAAVEAEVVDSAAAPVAAAEEPERPQILRGIYLNAYAAGSRKRLGALLELADRTEINAFVIDVKDERGVHYRTEVPLARELAQPGELTLGDLRTLVDTLHARGIYAMARIVVFKDPILSKARPEWSIQKPGGGLWVDKAGNTWVSAWHPDVWDYNIAIAEEAAKAGFDEIQFDYVRFPEPYPSLPEQVHARAAGERTDAIVAFLTRARERLRPLGAVVAADLFGLSMNEASDVRIGQQWERILAVADHVLPMVYPSHYFPTHLKGITAPNRMPYETIHKAVGMGVIRAERLRAAGGRTARIIPWLQAFDAPWVDKDFPYGPEQVAAQIRAVHDLGLESWILWHPGSKYEHVSATLAPTLEPKGRRFEPPAQLVAEVDVFDRLGAGEVRRSLAARGTGK